MFDEAIILAGGMGKRLRNVVSDLPKPMADINGIPFLEYLIKYLASYNIKKIIMSVGYKSEIIKNYFGEKFNDTEISYALEKMPLGTGGGIALAMQKAQTNDVFVLNGDTFFNISLTNLARFHAEKNASLTVALRKMENASRYGSIVINKSNRIEAFIEKNKKMDEALINGGIYILNKSVFLNYDMPEKFSFEKDFLQKYFKNENFFGLEFNDYFIDIGIPSSYRQAQSDFVNEFIKK
jgi:D-glycero-alpha-D-manno-heptose 1-phosphate guanylyltransferase